MGEDRENVRAHSDDHHLVGMRELGCIDHPALMNHTDDLIKFWICRGNSPTVGSTISALDVVVKCQR